MVSAAYLSGIRFNELDFRQAPVPNGANGGYAMKPGEPLRLAVLGKGYHVLQVGLQAGPSGQPRFCFSLYDDGYRPIERIYVDLADFVRARDESESGLVSAIDEALSRWFYEPYPDFTAAMAAAIARSLPPPKKDPLACNGNAGPQKDLSESLERIRRMRQQRKVAGRYVYGREDSVA